MIPSIGDNLPKSLPPFIQHHGNSNAHNFTTRNNCRTENSPKTPQRTSCSSGIASRLAEVVHNWYSTGFPWVHNLRSSTSFGTRVIVLASSPAKNVVWSGGTRTFSSLQLRRYQPPLNHCRSMPAHRCDRLVCRPMDRAGTVWVSFDEEGQVAL